MQRVVLYVLVALMFMSSAHGAGRMLMQQPTVTATILLSRASTRHDVCSATVLVRAADGSAVPQATVTFKTGPTIPARTTTSNDAGRITVMMPAEAATKSCTLQLLGVSLPGGAVALTPASLAPRTISWT